MNIRLEEIRYYLFLFCFWAPTKAASDVKLYQYLIESQNAVEPLWRNGLARCFPVLNTTVGRGCGFESRQWFINLVNLLAIIGSNYHPFWASCVIESFSLIFILVLGEHETTATPFPFQKSGRQERI